MTDDPGLGSYMNIGTASALTGVSAKTMRYYESIGLTEEPVRAANRYRAYSGRDIAVLRFIQRARSLGFSVRDVRDLLSLWNDQQRASANVKALALRHIGAIELKIAELRSIRQTLLDLTERCHGDDRPDCPILADLASGEVESRERAFATPKRLRPRRRAG